MPMPKTATQQLVGYVIAGRVRVDPARQRDGCVALVDAEGVIAWVPSESAEGIATLLNFAVDNVPER
jgi:hypothetical protein